MQINGVTLNFSFFDPDFEEGKKAYLKELEEISKIGDTGTEPDAIRQQCDTVKHLFDVTLGKAQGKKYAERVTITSYVWKLMKHCLTNRSDSVRGIEQ